MNVITSKTYCSDKHPYVYATLVDLAPKRGMIQIQSDWGTYAAIWNAMGDRTVREFVLDCGSDYIEGCFQERLNYLGVKREAFGRLTKFMAHCWPTVREMLRTQERENGLPTGTKIIDDKAMETTV